jgi:hypothetical protein
MYCPSPLLQHTDNIWWAVQYKTTGKIKVLCILIFTFLDDIVLDTTADNQIPLMNDQSIARPLHSRPRADTLRRPESQRTEVVRWLPSLLLCPEHFVLPQIRIQTETIRRTETTLHDRHEFLTAWRHELSPGYSAEYSGKTLSTLEGTYCTFPAYVQGTRRQQVAPKRKQISTRQSW